MLYISLASSFSPASLHLLPNIHLLPFTSSSSSSSSSPFPPPSLPLPSPSPSLNSPLATATSSVFQKSPPPVPPLHLLPAVEGGPHLPMKEPMLAAVFPMRLVVEGLAPA